VPAVSSVSPASIRTGSGATVTVSGTGFLPSTTATLGGISGAVAGGSITFNLPATVTGNAGTLSGIISNASPGGGSASFTVAILTGNPTVSGFSPASANAGSADTAIDVAGTNFVSGSTITLGGTPIPTTFVSAAALTATVGSSFLQRSGNLAVGVTNPPPGGGSAAGGTFTVRSALPTLTGVLPAHVPAGGSSTTVTLTGTGFAANTAVTGGSQPLALVFNSATSATVTLPASLLQQSGTIALALTNPPPGGGTSGQITLSVDNPVPVLMGVNPASLNTAGTNATLTLAGSNFTPGSVVNIGSQRLSTTFISPTTLTAALPPPYPLGKLSLTVTNPSPGGGSSNGVTIDVAGPGPAITGVSPASVGVGQIVSVTGTNFVAGSVVLLRGAAIPTTVVSTTQVTATIPANAAIGSSTIAVQDPSASTGAQASPPSPIQIVGPATGSTPVVSGVSPVTASAGTTQTITVTGSNFASGAQINVGRALVTPTASSPTTLTGTVTLPAAGNVNVSVTNPGGPTSNVMTFASLGPAPVVTSIYPRAGTAGATVEIALIGRNFVNGGQINVGGQLISPTAMNSTTMTAKVTLPESSEMVKGVLVQGSGGVIVRVVNPGNQMSNDVFIQVTAPPQ